MAVADTCPHGVWRCFVRCHHSVFGGSWADFPQGDRRGNKTTVVYVSWGSSAVLAMWIWLLPSSYYCHWKLHPALIRSTCEVGITRFVLLSLLYNINMHVKNLFLGLGGGGVGVGWEWSITVTCISTPTHTQTHTHTHIHTHTHCKV